MEFHVRVDRGEVEFIENGLVFDHECEEDLGSAFWDMIFGCSLVFRSVITKITDDSDEQEELIEKATSYLRNHAKATRVAYRRKFEYIETDPPRPEWYRFTHQVCQNWFENVCSYDDIDKLSSDIRAYGIKPRLEYDIAKDKLRVVLKPDSEHLSCGFSEELRAVGLKEDKNTIERFARASNTIATVLFDHVYGEKDNPLRADDYIHLDKQLPAFIESLENSGA